MSNAPSLLDPQTYLNVWLEDWPGYAKQLSPEAIAAIRRLIECAIHNAAERGRNMAAEALVTGMTREREACAKLIEEWPVGTPFSLATFAAAIRARGRK